MKDYAKQIRDNGNMVTGELLMEIIADHEPERDRMKRLYERYKARPGGVKIFSRSFAEFSDFNTQSMKRLDTKVNNTLNNAFDAEIVDTKIGYFLGHPITYDYDDNREPGTSSPIKDDIDIFNLRNHVEDKDAELGKKAAICGKAARLAYIDLNGDERIKNIDPWQVIFIGDDINEPEFSIRYYVADDEQTYAEFYNATKVYEFIEKDGKYELETEQEHLFDFNPLFGLPNNEEQQGDAEKVLMLIDAYDRVMSDASNEIEQYRLAYLVLKGMTADEEDADQMPRKRIINLLGENDDVSYLTKDINDDLIEHHLDRLGANIIRFAKSVDFTDEQFSGNVTGVALQHKLRPLETKCVTMERKFTAMLRYQFKVIFSARSKRMNGVSKDDYLKVFFTFTRNNPVNLVEEAQAAQALGVRFSQKTLYSLFSFIDDPDYEEQQVDEEMKDEYKRMDTQLGKVGEEDENAGGD